MAEPYLVYTGKEFVNLDNVFRIIPLGPGEVERRVDSKDYTVHAYLKNEATVVRVVGITATSYEPEYADPYTYDLYDGEAEMFLEGIGHPELFEVKEGINDEEQARLDEANAEYERQVEAGEREEMEGIPF